MILQAPRFNLPTDLRLDRRDVTRGLIGWWDCREGAGATTRDLSGHGRTGTLTDGAVWAVSPNGPAIASLTTSDRVQLPLLADNTYSALSVEVGFWFTRDSNWDGVGIWWHGSGGAYPADRNYIWGYTRGDQWNTRLTAGDDHTSVSVPGGTGYNVASGFVHLVLVYDGAAARMFYNGRQQGADVALSGNLRFISGAYGHRIFGTDNPLRNGLATVGRIYDVALTSGEVMRRYNIALNRNVAPRLWVVAPAGGEPVTVSPNPVVAIATGADPTTIQGSLGLSPSVAQAIAAGADPTTILGALDLSPAEAAANAAGADPLAMLGSLALSPSAAVAVASGADPTLTLGSLSLSPAGATAQAAGTDPSVMLGSLVLSPIAAAAIASAVDPSVVLGSLTLTPTAGAAQATGLGPTVVLGSLALSPDLAAAIAGALGPDTILGSIALTPGAAAAQASGAEPTVLLGSITIAPDAAAARAAGLDPTVIQAAITLTPVAASALAAGADPTVVVGIAGVVITPAAARAIATAAGPTVAIDAVRLTELLGAIPATVQLLGTIPGTTELLGTLPSANALTGTI